MNQKKELEEYIDTKQELIKDKYGVSKVYAPEDLDIVKEITFNTDVTSVDKIYKKIEMNHHLVFVDIK